MKISKEKDGLNELIDDGFDEGYINLKCQSETGHGGESLQFQILRRLRQDDQVQIPSRQP